MNRRRIGELSTGQHLELAMRSYIGQLRRREIPVPNDLELIASVITEVATRGHALSPVVNAEPAVTTEWLTVEIAAREADVSPSTIRRWTCNGLASARRGRIIRIHRTDLHNYLAQKADEQ